MIKYFKYHALGNDYIVIDPKYCTLDLTPKIIERICHRNFGVGSDGILLGPIYKDDNIHLRIFNPDGSEAEKSGNGIRIFSKYLIDHSIVADDIFKLYTLGGKVNVEKLKKDGSLLKVAMGKVTFESKKIPVLGENREVINEVFDFGGSILKATCVSIGNPHCVIPLDNISAELAHELGPKVENHELFPNRINMQLLEVIDRNNIKIEIWERGAGYTLASGSSSSAAASAAYKLGLVDENINVHMPGGTIHIFIDKDKMVYMTGSVNSVCEGILSNQFTHELKTLGK